MSNSNNVIQSLTAIAALANQVAPLVLELRTAVSTNDDAAVEALLAKVQAVNDQLGTM